MVSALQTSLAPLAGVHMCCERIRGEEHPGSTRSAFSHLWTFQIMVSVAQMGFTLSGGQCQDSSNVDHMMPHSWW